jgi:hypothetical protein
MTAMLPPPRDSGGCQAPAGATLTKISADLYRPRPGVTVGIALPTVTLSSHQDMNGLLTRLGMGIAFGGLADFTGLSPRACAGDGLAAPVRYKNGATDEQSRETPCCPGPPNLPDG